MVWHHLFMIIFAVLFFAQISTTNAVASVVSAESSIKTIQLFGDTYTLGLFEIQFNDTLVVRKPFKVCARCPSTDPPACPPCYYNDPLVCVNNTREGTSCPCKAGGYQYFQCLLPQVNGTTGLNVTYESTEAASTMFVVSLPKLETCTPILYQVVPQDSYGLAIGALSIFINATLYSRPLFGDTFLSFCPEDQALVPGTSTIQTDLNGPHAQTVTTHLKSHLLASTADYDVPVTCTLPSTVTAATHECLSPGVRRSFPMNIGRPKYVKQFVVPLPDTGCFYLSHGGDHLASWMSFIDPFVGPNSTDPGLMYFNAQQIFIENTAVHTEMAEFLRYVCLTGSGPHYLYAYVILDTQDDRDGEGQHDVWFSVSQNNLRKIPFSEINYQSSSFNFLNAITLRCGNKVFTNLEGTPDFFPIDSGILNTRVLFPQKEPHFFYPLPLYLTYDERFTQTIPNPTEFVPGKFVVGVLLDWDRHSVPSNPTDPVFPKLKSFLTPEEFATCKLEFHGTVSGETDDVPITETIQEFTPKALVCDVANFKSSIDQINQKLGKILDTVSVADILNLGLELNLISSSDGFWSCYRDIIARIATFPQERSFVTDSCVYADGSQEYAEDPCCNPQIDEYQSCSRHAVKKNISMFLSANTNGCSSPQCAEHLMTKLQNELTRITSPEGCRSSVPEISSFRSKEIYKYVQCRRKFLLGRINIYGAGTLACKHDNDCPGETSFCGFHRACIMNTTYVSEQILKCMIETMDSYVLVRVKEKLGAADITPEALRLSLETSSSTCVDKSGTRFSPTKQSLISCDRRSGCEQGFANTAAGGGPAGLPSPESAFFKWYDIYDMYPFGQDCLQSCGGTLRVQYSEFVFGLNCSKIYCNWFQCSADVNDVDCIDRCDNSSLTPGFCGICDDTIQCVDYTDLWQNQTACTAGYLCLHADGTNTTVATPDDCTNIYSCDHCKTPPCTQAQCEEEDNGYCTDRTDTAYGLWVRAPFNTTSGACLVEVMNRPPFDQTKSAECVFPAIITLLGFCLDPTVTEAECNENYPHQSTFSYVRNYRWVTPADTKLQCDSYADVCFNAPHFEFAVASGIRNAQTRPLSSADDCTGIIAPMFSWIRGRWLPGQVRKPEWRLRQTGNRYELNKVDFHWDVLSETVAESVTDLYGLRVQDELYCTYGESTRLLNEIACLCDQQPEAECLANSSEITAISAVCANAPVEITVSPFTFTNVSTTTIDAENLCERITWKITPRLEFRSTSIERIALLLVDYHEDQNFTVRNDNGAIYARVMTDGISYRCALTLQSLNVTVAKQTKGIWDDERFPVLDVAMRLRSGLLAPLEIDVYETEDNYTFTINVLQNDTAYFVVHRVDENSLTYQRKFFSAGELAYLSIILALYAVGVIGSLAKLVIFLFFQLKREAAAYRLLAVLFTLFSFFVFRVVLFSLVLSGAIVDTRSPTVGYVLIEFPIVLFFSFVTQYIVLWLFLVKITAKTSSMLGNWTTIASMIVLLCNFFLLTIFVIMIILFESIVSQPELICNNEVTVYDSQTAFTILMVYRAIFSFISIALGFLLLISGSTLLGKFAKELKLDKTLRIFSATIAGTFGLVAQGIYYLIITATRATISNYVSLSLLLIIEIVPAFCFLLLSEVSLKGFASKISSLTGTINVGAGSASSQPGR